MREPSCSRQELSGDTQFAVVSQDKSGSCSGKLHNTRNQDPHNHGRHQRKWPPNAPNEASSPTTTRWIRMDGWPTPQASRYHFGGSEGVYGPQSTPLFWQWCITATAECFEGHTPPQHPQIRAQGFVCGSRGPFLLVTAVAGYCCDGRCWLVMSGLSIPT
jgi:hypothetical protein